MTQAMIQLKIESIIQELFPVKKELLMPQNYDARLTGDVFEFGPTDLGYLFFAVEDSFGIQIDMNDPKWRYCFNSINDIVTLVAAHIEFQEEQLAQTS
jgi:acyl carrier protein